MNTLPDRDEPNPFAAPESGFQTPRGATDSARVVQLNVEDVVSTSWAIFRRRGGAVMALFWGMVILNVLMRMGLGGLPRMLGVILRDPETIRFLNVMVSIASEILSIWLSVGMNRALLKLARNEPVEFAELTRGGPYLLTIVLGWVAIWAMLALPSLLVLSTIGMVLEAPSLGGLLGSGLMSMGALAVGFYVLTRLYYFMLVCLDENTGVLDSLRGSWEATRGNLSGLILVAMAQLAINLVGILLLCVGVLVTLPFTSLINTVTYLKLFEGRWTYIPSDPKPIADPDRSA